MKKKTIGSDAYAKAGVNLTAGDAFSAYAGGICKGSYRNSRFVRVDDWSEGHFRGPRAFEFVNLPPGTKQVGGSDGIGTKTIVITAADRLDTSADNLLAMTAGDVTRWGGKALLFFNCLEAKSLGEIGSRAFNAFKSLMWGLGEAAQRQEYVLFSGETAEMSHASLRRSWVPTSHLTGAVP